VDAPLKKNECNRDRTFAAQSLGKNEERTLAVVALSQLSSSLHDPFMPRRPEGVAEIASWGIAEPREEGCGNMAGS
jgi:hypothetical protein